MTNGDLPTAPLLEPIDNIIGLGPHGLTATRYQVSIIHWFNVVGAWVVPEATLYKRTYKTVLVYYHTSMKKLVFHEKLYTEIKRSIQFMPYF